MQTRAGRESHRPARERTGSPPAHEAAARGRDPVAKDHDEFQVVEFVRVSNVSRRYGQDMAARGALMAGIAKQLGHPRGVGGRVVGLALNRGNRGFVNAAVQALHADNDAVVADVGFGGGIGLALLLDSVGSSGRVHGVEVSDTMLTQAARRYRRDIAVGRLTLHNGSLTRLPFADGALTGALTVNTIYFVPGLQEAFTELARVMAPSGASSSAWPTPRRWRSYRSPATASAFVPYPR